MSVDEDIHLDVCSAQKIMPNSPTLVDNEFILEEVIYEADGRAVFTCLSLTLFPKQKLILKALELKPKTQKATMAEI